MTITEKINIYTKAYDRFRNIEDMKDLKKEKLTLTEYDAVYDVLKTLSRIDDSKTTTFVKAVADWFKRNGFSVIQGTGVNCISWIIKIA